MSRFSEEKERIEKIEAYRHWLAEQDYPIYGKGILTQAEELRSEIESCYLSLPEIPGNYAEVPEMLCANDCHTLRINILLAPTPPDPCDKEARPFTSAECYVALSELLERIAAQGTFIVRNVTTTEQE
jgi:hypothetical protein